ACLSRFNGPVGCLAFVGTAGVLIGSVKQVRPYVFPRQVVDRIMTSLLDAEGSTAFGDGRSAEHDPDAPGLRQKLDTMVGVGHKTRGWVRHLSSSDGDQGQRFVELGVGP